MKKTLITAAVTLLAVLVLAGPVMAAGFGIYEWSARGNALGGAMVARADDASAVAFNPAGMIQLEGTHIMAGSSFITPLVTVETELGGFSSSDNNVANTWIIPHVYVTQQLTDRVWLGVGEFTRFGLGSIFDEGWAGRYNNYRTEITSFSVNPSVAVEIFDGFALAVGVEAMYFDLTMCRKIDGAGLNDPTTNLLDVDMQLKGSSWGFGFNVGLHWKPVDWFALGVTYRSNVEQNLNGEAEFDKPAVFALNPLNPLLFNDTGVTGKILLPDSISAGVMIKPLDELSVELGFVYTRWSSYAELEIEFDDELVPGAGTTSTTEKEWNDVMRFNAGVEYSPLEWLDIRASYVFDQSPVPDDHADYIVPADDRHLLSLGIGLEFEDFTADLGYTHLIIEERDVDARLAEGVFDSKFTGGVTHIFSVSFGYRF